MLVEWLVLDYLLSVAHLDKKMYTLLKVFISDIVKIGSNYLASNFEFMLKAFVSWNTQKPRIFPHRIKARIQRAAGFGL